MFHGLPLSKADPAVWAALEGERVRQESHIELIASENYVSPNVLAVQGSIFTNKYAEGYPGKRYYEGCEYADRVEQLAIDRAKQLFSADYVNVQPHSGSQANAAVYMALLQPGDVILGMGLASGGHLTHGAAINFSGRLYQAIAYGIREATGEIDFDQVAALAREHRPKLIIAGFSAYSRIIPWERFRTIADEVGAYLLVDMAHVAGLVAAKLYPSPVGIADVTTATTHKTLRGPRGGLILARHNPSLEKKLNTLVFPGTQGGPLMHVIAAKAVAFQEALRPEFIAYQQQVIVNAKALASALLANGYALVTGGTDNHQLLVDFRGHALTGKAASAALAACHIITNKNAVPNDPHPPSITSGIRLGTPAVTTRGFKEPEMVQLATWITAILERCVNGTLSESYCAEMHAKVLTLCNRFPVYA